MSMMGLKYRDEDGEWQTVEGDRLIVSGRSGPVVVVARMEDSIAVTTRGEQAFDEYLDQIDEQTVGDTFTIEFGR